MKLILLFSLIVSSVFAQEGRAVKPLIKPTCETNATGELITRSCFFKNYRFTSGSGSNWRDNYKVAKMENGSYVVTENSRIFKDNVKALAILNKKIQMEFKRMVSQKESCASQAIEKDFSLNEMVFSFDDKNKAVMYVYYDLPSACSNDDKIMTSFSIQEFDKLLK